jgi:hypothetical protein
MYPAEPTILQAAHTTFNRIEDYKSVTLYPVVSVEVLCEKKLQRS